MKRNTFIRRRSLVVLAAAMLLQLQTAAWAQERASPAWHNYTHIDIGTQPEQIVVARGCFNWLGSLCARS